MHITSAIEVVDLMKPTKLELRVIALRAELRPLEEIAAKAKADYLAAPADPSGRAWDRACDRVTEKRVELQLAERAVFDEADERKKKQAARRWKS